MAGKPQFVELEQRQVGAFAGGNATEFGPADARRRAFGRPAQRVLVADLADAIARALDQEGGAHLLHQVGAIVRRRAVDADADMHADRFQLAHRAMTGGEHLVRAGAMADGNAGLGEPRHLFGFEMNAVGQPDAAFEPAAGFEIIERPAAVELMTEVVLVVGFGKMRVQANIQFARKIGGGAHQRGGDRERRAGRQRDLRHRPLPALMVAADQPLAVRQDRVLVLHHAVRRQAAITLGKVHGAAGEQHAQAQPLRGGDLDVDAVLEPGGKDVMMVGGGGAARQHQLGHGDGGGEIERLGRQPRPHRVERLQPGEQLAVERGRQRAGERLVEMVVGVDKPGQDDVLAGVVRFRARGLWLFAGGDQLDDLAVLDDHATLGAVRQDRQRVLDPDGFAHCTPRVPRRSYPSLQIGGQRRAVWT